MNTLLEKVELGKEENKEANEIFYGSKILLANPGREGISDQENKDNLPRKLLAGRDCSGLSINLDEWPVGGLEAFCKQDIPLTAGNINLEQKTGCVRNSFKVVKPDGTESNEVLRYGDKFALQALCGSEPMYVFTDRLRLGSQVLATKKIQVHLLPSNLLAQKTERYHTGVFLLLSLLIRFLDSNTFHSQSEGTNSF